MYEVELKVAADLDVVRDRLTDRDAEALGAVTQVDTYFDAPHRDFAETDEAFRIRRETADGETVAELTYKGPKVDAESKTRREVETEVVDAEAASDIAAALGFEPAAEVRKERERYRYRDYTVTLDAVDGVGEFVEVEREAEAVESAREGAKEVLADLGLDHEEQVRTSYLGLLLAEDASKDTPE